MVDAAGLDRFSLLGVSRGAAVALAYAARHPERLTHLVLYGGFARGRMLRRPEDRLQQEALISAIRAGWADPDPTFRHVFSMLFLPRGTPEQMAWFDDLQRRSTSAATAVRLYDARGGIDVVGVAPRVTTPTLVLHARDDRVVAVEEGRLLAALIPDARLVLLESANHLLLADEPAWSRFLSEVRAFLGTEPGPGRPVEDLSARELEVLGLRGRGADQRGDRRAPVPQRPHGGAAPLQHLREAAGLRQGGTGRRRREVLPCASVPAGSADRPACRPPSLSEVG